MPGTGRAPLTEAPCKLGPTTSKRRTLHRSGPTTCLARHPARRPCRMPERHASRCSFHQSSCDDSSRWSLGPCRTGLWRQAPASVDFLWAGQSPRVSAPWSRRRRRRRAIVHGILVVDRGCRGPFTLRTSTSTARAVCQARSPQKMVVAEPIMIRAPVFLGWHVDDPRATKGGWTMPTAPTPPSTTVAQHRASSLATKTISTEGAHGMRSQANTLTASGATQGARSRAALTSAISPRPILMRNDSSMLRARAWQRERLSATNVTGCLAAGAVPMRATVVIVDSLPQRMCWALLNLETCGLCTDLLSPHCGICQRRGSLRGRAADTHRLHAHLRTRRPSAD